MTDVLSGPAAPRVRRRGRVGGPWQVERLRRIGRPWRVRRSHRGWRSVAGAGALLVLATGLAVGGPAPAAEAAACSGSTGVTVVVDFGSLGGGVQVSCAGGNPGSGLAALSGAGHGYTFVPRQPGLVCQVDARPNPCNGAPTTAYWAYWHASRGGSWSYSSLGAGGYDPAPGTVEGWAFGAGRQPGIAPPAAPAPPRPAPKPTTNPAPRPTAQPPAAPPRGSAPGAGAPESSTGGGAPRETAPGRPPGTAGPSPGRTTTAAQSISAGPTATDGTAACSTGAVAAPSNSASPTPTRSSSACSTGAGAAPSTSDSGPSELVAAASLFSWRRIAAFALALALITAVAVTGFLIARRRRTDPPI